MKGVMQDLFLRTLAHISLDRFIPEKVSCRDAILQVGAERVELDLYSRIVVIAMGKAAFQMVETTMGILPPHSVTGVVTGVGCDDVEVPGFARFRGGHPYPNSDSLRSAEAVVELLRTTTAQDLILFLLSGGGSALCEKPISKKITLADLHEFYRLLVTCGASIVDVNFVRKHLSAIKGGRLAEMAFPARQITLYVSDAPPDCPSNVASGPTMPDESSVDECRRIVERLDLMPVLPPSIRDLFEKGGISETPKSGADCFRSSSWHCLLAPEEAVEVLASECRRGGWIVATDMSITDDCPLPSTTRRLLSKLEELRAQHPGRTVSIIAGGEFSCPVTGDGVGGRNQAFVLDCVPQIAGRNIAVFSAGTDGVDGTSPAAGAVADGGSLAKADRLGLDPADYAARSDSYGFFSKLDDVVMTGPTGNNVRDLRILVEW